MASKTRRRRGLLAGKGQSPLGLPVPVPTSDETSEETAEVESEAPVVDEPAAEEPAADAPADASVISDAPGPPPVGSPAHDFFSASGSNDDDAFDPVVEDAPTVPMTEGEAGDDEHIVGTEVVEDAARTSSGYYVETGEMPADTQELGWSSDVFGGRGDTGPPASQRVAGPVASDLGRSLAAELFSEPESGDFFDDLTDPPTEEVPATLSRHIGGTSRDTASMDLPEPPPLPGIMDRFKPPPVKERSEITNRLRRDASFEPDQPTRTPATPQRSAPIPSEHHDEPESNTGLVLAAASVGGLLAVILIMGWQVVRGSVGAPPDPTPPPAIEAPVQVAPEPAPPAPVIETPDLSEEPEATEDEPVEDDPAEDDPAEEPTAEDPAPEEPAAAPAPDNGGVILSDPTERAAPTPKPKPATTEVSRPPTNENVWGATTSGDNSAATGTLRIRTNVRALVQVDGGTQQYASRPLELSVGTHEIKAFRPGRLDTAQTKTVEIVEGEVATVQFSF